MRLEIARPPRQVTACNCSICRHHGALRACYTRKSVRLVAAADACGDYRSGRKSIVFRFCKPCACITHYERSREGRDDTVAVNARNLPPEVLASLRVRRFDGADTGTYLE